MPQTCVNGQACILEKLTTQQPHLPSFRQTCRSTLIRNNYLNIRGGCSVDFPGRMSIGQGNEESMGIWWTRLIQVTWNDSIDQGVLTETRILQIRRLVDFAWRSSTNGFLWSIWQPCRYHSINYCLFVTVWLLAWMHACERWVRGDRRLRSPT